MLHLPLLQQTLPTRNNKGVTQIWDPTRRKWLIITPEEHVRQCLLKYLTEEMQYPSALIGVERGLSFGHTTLRFDIVIYHRQTEAPWMLVECKSPEVPITDAVLQQLLQYHSRMPECRYWLLTNGIQSYCADAANAREIKWLDALPAY